jgi:hypothetical protein
MFMFGVLNNLINYYSTNRCYIIINIKKHLLFLNYLFLSIFIIAKKSVNFLIKDRNYY